MPVMHASARELAATQRAGSTLKYSAGRRGAGALSVLVVPPWSAARLRVRENRNGGIDTCGAIECVLVVPTRSV